MSKSTGVLTAVLTLLLAAACSGGGRGEQATATDEPTGRILRGAVSFADDVHTFRPCGEDEPLWIASGAELLGEAAAQFEAFVVIEATSQQPPAEGPGAAYRSAVAVESVLYFGQEGPSCDFAWDSFDYRARGNEPFWMLEVGDMPGNPNFKTLAWVRPGERGRLLGGFVEEVSPDGSSIRIARSGQGGDESEEGPELIELIMRREPCRDTMSGAYFGLSARFRYLGGTFTGCVLVGSPEPSPPSSSR